MWSVMCVHEGGNHFADVYNPASPAALPIVSQSLCLLSRFLANNGNGWLSLDGYFMHQQSVIQH